MDVWQSILVNLGGNAALLIVLGWLARSLGSQVLAKDLESFKSSLSSATSEASERLKHQLQLASHEHQVRFSKLHEKRGEVIASLYALLVEVQWAGQSLVSVIKLAGEPSKEKEYVAAMNKFAEFFREFDRNRIFLPDSVCTQIDEFFKGMRQRVIHFGVYAQTNEHAPEHVIKEKYEGWAKSSEYFDTEVPRARRTLESELRAMLSGEVPMSPNPSIDRAD